MAILSVPSWGTKTGGTKLPQAPAPKAPHVPGTGVQHTAPGVNKAPAPKAATAHNNVAANRQKAAAKTQGRTKTTTTTRTTTKTPTNVNPLETNNVNALKQYDEEAVNKSLKAEEVPAKARIGEIHEIAQAGENRQAQANTAAASDIEGLRQNAVNSAKTTDNEAAEHAQAELSQTNAPAGATVGQLAAANAGQQAIGSTEREREGTAQSLQGNENEYLTKLQAIAGIRGGEDVAHLAGRYATEEGTENTDIAKAQAKAQGEVPNLLIKQLPEAEKSRLALAEYGLKAGQLKVNESKATTTKISDEAKNKQGAEKVTIAKGEAKRKAAETASQEAYRNSEASAKQQEINRKNAEGAAKIKEIEAKTAKDRSSGALTSAQQSTLNEISKAAQFVKLAKQEGKSKAEILGYLNRGTNVKVKSGVFATAAVEAVEKGWLNNSTKKALEKAGQIPAGFKVTEYILS